jgi:hypothetical protein
VAACGIACGLEEHPSQLALPTDIAAGDGRSILPNPEQITTGIEDRSDEKKRCAGPAYQRADKRQEPRKTRKKALAETSVKWPHRAPKPPFLRDLRATDAA